MTIDELRKITADFDDIKLLIEERQKYKQIESRIRRKLKTTENKYAFLRVLTSKQSGGNKLVDAVKEYFKVLGFTDVHNVDKLGGEDLRLYVGNRLLIFEITADENGVPKDNKVHQISKHIPLRKSQNPNKEVLGVFLVNHDYNQPIEKRQTKPFRKDLIEIAKSHNYSLV